MRLQEIKTGDQLQMELIAGLPQAHREADVQLAAVLQLEGVRYRGVRRTEIAFAPNCGDWNDDLTVVAELSPDDSIRRWRYREGCADTEIRVDDLGAIDFDHLDEFLQKLRRGMKASE